MFQRILHVAAALAALPIVFASNPASACHGDCYKKVHKPAVYTTVAHPVVAHRKEVVHSPAVYATIHRTASSRSRTRWSSAIPDGVPAGGPPAARLSTRNAAMPAARAPV